MSIPAIPSSRSGAERDGGTVNLFETLKNILKTLDADESGALSLDEFTPAYMKLNPLATTKMAMKVFDEIDTNASRTITLEELGRHYGFKFNSSHMLDAADIDTKGMTDEQLISLMRLNSIASDSRMQRMQQADFDKRTTNLKAKQVLLEEQKLLMTMSNAHRLDSRRRSSTMLQIPLGDLVKHNNIKEHSSLPESEGEGALHKLCRLGDAGCTKTATMLLEAGVDIDYQDRNGKTAAHYAAEYGHANMLAWLFAKGANATLAAIDGWSVLHEAVFNGDKSCIDLLLHMHNGPDINMRDSHMRTALHVAAYRCGEDIIHLLIDNGADPILEDTQLMNAADLAGRAGRRSSATFLEGQPSLLGSPEQLRRQIIGGRGRRGSRDIGAEMARLPVAKAALEASDTTNAAK
ncbi:ankyrin repeat-containing domain protein [Pavlovales sp. CCMP2436]|nr:ankyrin repeat-containing domain protein [Pavlovales sp. CCMP2436]